MKNMSELRPTHSYKLSFWTINSQFLTELFPNKISKAKKNSLQMKANLKLSWLKKLLNLI